MRSVLPLFGLASALAAAWPAAAQSLSGPATALDGDSLTMSGIQVRLHGIDAPEGRQTCERDGQAWPCGEAAAQRLRDMVAGNTVFCRGQGTDAYGRIVATCSAGGAELNRAMVAGGWATAFRRYSDAYLPDETRARQARLGIWGSQFVPPEEYRAANRHADPAERTAAPIVVRPRATRGAVPGDQSCAIKGNHSRKGDMIYHLPGMPYYEQTRAEQMFCTEAEALAAGYRRSRADMHR